MIRNPHTMEDSWWDGPERLQYVNRNVVAYLQNEDLFKFTKIFAPLKMGLHIGGWVKENGRANWIDEKEPLTILMDLDTNKITDIYARAEKLPFKDECFGYIVSFHVLEHVRGDLVLTLSEWLRVLTPCGLISLSMPNKRYFLHDCKKTADGECAYHEMEADDLLSVVNRLSNAEILLFDSRKNNFDIDIIIRKK